ncbi:MAG TPA: hypothetical protein VEF76_13445 [Patescibacteria group bacterium]|nr:hypothetical protein [Patescibacteria group bacterium]
MSVTAILFTVVVVLVALYLARDAITMRVSDKPKKEFWVNPDPNDPLMLAAVDKARATLPRFDALRAQYPRSSSLALGPLSQEGDMTPALVEEQTATGYLVRRAKNDETGVAVAEGEAFAVTPADIVDWIVYESEKKDRIHGGYTIRAVAAMADRDGIKIPVRSLLQLRKFVED